VSLVFYPKSHRYKLDGDWVPGVTTITGVLDKSGPLISWASGLVAEYVADNREVMEGLWLAGRDPLVAALKKLPEAARKRAAERGTDFHDYAEQIVRGEEVDVPEDHVPLVESALAFFADWKIEPVLIETSVASREYAYAGTLDLVADHANGPRAIFDWKTGKAIYDSAAWQANGYGAAEFYGADAVSDGTKVTYQDERPMSDLGIEQAWGIHIRADGYDVYPLYYGPDVFEKFRLIRRLYDINKRARGDWKIPGSGYVGAAIQRRLEKEIA
jgi:hypothetical protein